MESPLLALTSVRSLGKLSNMRTSSSRRLLVFLAFALSLLTAASLFANEPVRIERVPDGGLQPQAVVDQRGVLHLLYYKGDPAAGDLYYCIRSPGSPQFSPPLRVNSRGPTAIAIGTIRGAQLAVAHGHVHVAWNGRAPEKRTYMDAPMLYTRLASDGHAFEPERNLITFARGLDGGGSLAADAIGNVYVFWHAPTPGNTNGEAGRALYVSHSQDDGKTFAPETLATDQPTGACACCGAKAFCDPAGRLFALFRGAQNSTNRAELLLAGPAGEPLRPILRDPWPVAACPMSSASFAAHGTKVFAAWESRGDVSFCAIENGKPSSAISPPSPAKRKYPALAVNSNGELLLAWTERTSWGKGGQIVWQRFSPGLTPIDTPSRRDGLPAWSMPAVVAQPDGTFILIY